jgi:hypothetical protein
MPSLQARSSLPYGVGNPTQDPRSLRRRRHPASRTPGRATPPCSTTPTRPTSAMTKIAALTRQTPSMQAPVTTGGQQRRSDAPPNPLSFFPRGMAQKTVCLHTFRQICPRLSIIPPYKLTFVPDCLPLFSVR